MDSEQYFLVIDLEATCDANGRIPRNETEIIEIGAVLVDGTTLSPIAELQSFVRPVRHPALTPFCTSLTSITQADVAIAPLFPAAIARVREFLRGLHAGGALFCSWGDYDRAQFARDAERHRIELPFGPRHLNLKQRFSDVLGESKRYGMAEALRRVGVPLVGTHHRGIDDARNIARLLPWIVGGRPVQAPRPDRASRA
jgi:inhibitor of KinA sporulation pathway (predicted exonuclease)